MDEGQREQWWSDFHGLMAELTGCARRRRSWRTWGPRAALALAFVLLLAVSAVRFDPTVGFDRHAPFWVTFGLIGIGAVLLLTGCVLSWRAGTMGGSRYSPTAVLGPDQQRRCLALINGADPDDPHQVEAAADLARRVSVQRSQGFLNAAPALLMFSLVLGGNDLLLSAAVLLVAFAHLAELVARELRVQSARRFLRGHGQPTRMAAAAA